jgi:hypothetical protein
MFTFILTMAIIGAFLLIGVAINMRIRKFTPRKIKPNRPTHTQNLHNAIFARENNEEDMFLLNQ